MSDAPRLEQTMDGWWSLWVGHWWTKVEGDAAQWTEMASALEERRSCSFSRMGYDPRTKRMRSPRNTAGPRDQPSVDGHEDDLAAAIREAVKHPRKSESFGDFDD